MTSKQRILAAMTCREVDRIPFVPNLNGYTIRGLPEKYQRMPRWEILQELGIDLLVRFRTGVRSRPPLVLIPPPEGPLNLAPAAARDWAKSQPGTDKVRIKPSRNNGVQYLTVQTPVGQLRCGWQYTTESPDIPFPVEYLIKSYEDIKIYHYILDHTVTEAAYKEVESALEGVKGEGTCEAAGGSTPMQDLIEMLIGVENFYYLMNDHPAEMEQLMAHMLEVREREYRLLAAGPAEIVVTGENTSTTLASPDYMAHFEFPALNRYSDIVHRGGKIHMVHMCGRLRGALHLLVQARFDGIHDAAPPPTGDLPFGPAREQLSASGKCISGGIDCTAFVSPGPQQLEAYVAQRLAEVAPGTGFLLGSGDTVPFGTTVENLKAVVRAVERYGRYPLKRKD